MSDFESAAPVENVVVEEVAVAAPEVTEVAEATDAAAPEAAAAEKAPVADRNAFKVFVGGLAEGVTEDELRALFQNAGAIQEIALRRNYAFITYTSDDDVQAALQLNGSQLNNATLIVEAKRQNKRGRKDGDDHGRNNNNRRNNNNHQKDSQGNGENRAERVCYKCNKPGHIAARCGESERLCFHCQKSGHLARDCPKAPTRPFGGDRRRERRDDSRDRRRRDDSRDRRDRSRSRRRDDSRDRRRRDDSRDRREDSRDRRRRDDSRDDKKRRRL